MEDKSRAYYKRLLSQYIDGSISKKDKFALEKHALDDPFLFEALEGLQNKNRSANEIIKKLKSNVDQSDTARKKRIIPLFNYGIAASFVLLLGVGLWMFNTNTTPSDTITMNTIPASKDMASEIAFDKAKEISTIKKSKKLETKPSESSNKNQYDTPKAIIAQKDNEENFVKRKADQTFIKENANKELAASPQKNKNNSSTNNNDAVNQAGQAPLLESTGVVESEPSITAAGKLIIDEVVTESIVQDEQLRRDKPAAKKRSTFSSSKVSAAKLELHKSEYISSLDENILVAPPNGITSFLSNLANDNDLSELDQSTIKEVLIEFKLSSNGIPTDLKIISSEMNDCSKKAIEAIKNSGNWISYPQNSEAVVRLKAPCL